MKVAIQSNVSEQPYLEETELMTEVLQKPYDGETRQTLKESISANQCCHDLQCTIICIKDSDILHVFVYFSIPAA